MSTKTLDHIVHLTPPGTVQQTAEQFRQLGFNVLDGGVHADGLTENSLVILSDHVYLELISFTKPPEAYPPSSPSRRKRESHKWASRAPGWIDYAFLGNGSLTPPERISDIINGRTSVDSAPLYLEEVPGGRTRPDGEVLKWVISAPAMPTSILPFFCGDLTDRRKRVPTHPDSNAHHPSGALGIAHVLLLTSDSSFAAVHKEISVVIGEQPVLRTAVEVKWRLSTLNSERAPTLVLATPSDQEQEHFVEESRSAPGIYEVGFWVGEDGREGTVTTPFGRIVWVAGGQKRE
ncbi:glyoxalase-like domain-containing protein [Mycena albidolilacea]|uniref:Glyoxalase-like domain-containing protein n=1 Tax=Mycena albidolilacea TaxID=1033008 RepID=A0AAD7A3R2_9AGAR|nr:glyoxalase-like domain-containing protein [Mycena albidolilacea]